MVMKISIKELEVISSRGQTLSCSQQHVKTLAQRGTGERIEDVNE